LQNYDLKKIQKNHAEMYSFQHTNHTQNCQYEGKITSSGFTIAQKGHPGDKYSSFEVDVNDKISSIKLFAWADICFHFFILRIFLIYLVQDVQIVMDILRCASPHIYAELKSKAKEASTYSLGRFGLNIYCWNYIAPQHADLDHF
jgi:hypothetical protein